MYFANMPRVFINIVLAFINVRDVEIATTLLVPMSGIWKQHNLKNHVGYKNQSL